MMFLGDANTRDRDYGDVYLLSEIHAVEAEPYAMRCTAWPSIVSTRCVPWDRFSRPCARADSSRGRHFVPVPDSRDCPSASPTLLMPSSTS